MFGRVSSCMFCLDDLAYLAHHFEWIKKELIFLLIHLPLIVLLQWPALSPPSMRRPVQPLRCSFRRFSIADLTMRSARGTTRPSKIVWWSWRIRTRALPIVWRSWRMRREIWREGSKGLRMMLKCWKRTRRRRSDDIIEGEVLRVPALRCDAMIGGMTKGMKKARLSDLPKKSSKSTLLSKEFKQNNVWTPMFRQS